MSMWLGCSSLNVEPDLVLPTLPKAERQEANAFVDYLRVLPIDRWDDATFLASDKSEFGYRVYKPEDAEGPLPVIVYLHDAKGRGKKNNKQLQNANVAPSTTWTVPQVYKEYPSMVVAPQCGPGDNWTGVADKEQPPEAREPKPCLEPVAELIKYLRGRPDIDGERVYLIGAAMGADGATELVARYPELIAATVLITSDPVGRFRESVIGSRMSGMAKEPLWHFHGSSEADDTDARALVERMRSAGGKNAIFWRYEGGMARTRAPREKLLREWLFAQSQG